MTKPSRHLDTLLSRVARDFICASAEGLGVGVAVTRRELITCKARLFGGPVLSRYRLGDIDTTRLRLGHSVGFLRVTFVKQNEASVMLLFGSAHTADFERVAAALARLAPPRNIAARRRRVVLSTPARAFAGHTM